MADHGLPGAPALVVEFFDEDEAALIWHEKLPAVPAAGDVLTLRDERFMVTDEPREWKLAQPDDIPRVRVSIRPVR